MSLDLYERQRERGKARGVPQAHAGIRWLSGCHYSLDSREAGDDLRRQDRDLSLRNQHPFHCRLVMVNDGGSSSSARLSDSSPVDSAPHAR